MQLNKISRLSAIIRNLTVHGKACQKWNSVNLTRPDPRVDPTAVTTARSEGMYNYTTAAYIMHVRCNSQTLHVAYKHDLGGRHIFNWGDTGTLVAPPMLPIINDQSNKEKAVTVYKRFITDFNTG